jgi:hypothetical protein
MEHWSNGWKRSRVSDLKITENDRACDMSSLAPEIIFEHPTLHFSSTPIFHGALHAAV